MLELAERYRELGRFADAKHAMASVPHEHDPVARKLIAGLIEREKAPPYASVIHAHSVQGTPTETCEHGSRANSTRQRR